MIMTLKASTKNKGLPKEGDTFVTSFARGLSVIRAFQHSTHALTLSEVAHRAEMSPATARRLLHTLLALEYAGLEGNRFYLTPRVLELGFAYLSTLSLHDIARPLVDAFTRETGLTCTISVLDNQDVVYVVRADVQSPLSQNLNVGERLPAHATSSGHILLTTLSEEELNTFVSQPLTRFTPKTKCTPKALREAISTAKENGWALANEELELGVCGLAVPIYNEHGAVMAALTVSANLARYTAEDMQQLFLQRLLKAAEQISIGRRGSR